MRMIKELVEDNHKHYEKTRGYLGQEKYDN